METKGSFQSESDKFWEVQSDHMEDEQESFKDMTEEKTELDAVEGKIEKNEIKISFDVFAYLYRIYQVYGLHEENMERCINFLKKKKRNLKSRVLDIVENDGKYAYKLYPKEIHHIKYFEFLLIEAELCRCRYTEIKRDMNNLKVPYRAKYHYINRLKKAFERINFLYSLITQETVEGNTELQVRCFKTFIETTLLMETGKLEECLFKVDECTKLFKLIKRIILNALTEKKKKEKKKREDEEEPFTDVTEKANRLLSNKQVDPSLKEEEQKIEEMFEYFQSSINSYKRFCEYNLKKKINNASNEKLQEEDFINDINCIVETEIQKRNDESQKLQIRVNESITTIVVGTSEFKIFTLNNSIIKIKNNMEEIKTVISKDVINKLNVESNQACIKTNVRLILEFVEPLEETFIINSYGNILMKYFDSISIVHEELIKNTNKQESLSMTEQKMERMWNLLENYFTHTKIYLDLERTLLILMKTLTRVYTTDDDMKNYSFYNKKTFEELLEPMPILQEGIRYADILRQNIDELQNFEKNESFTNMYLIIKNVKSLSLAFYYAISKEHAEAHVLFDSVRSRNYVHVKINEDINSSDALFRVAVLFNRIQDLVFLINEKYYLRHLSIYTLHVKSKEDSNKSDIMNKSLIILDNSLFNSEMYPIGLNPLLCEMASLYNNEETIQQIYKTDKTQGSGISGLIKSFWKK